MAKRRGAIKTKPSVGRGREHGYAGAGRAAGALHNCSYVTIPIYFLGVNMSPSDWASWMQAVGSIAAIIGSFRIARRQHEHERAADRVRRHDEIQEALDEQLRARTVAVRNVVQVATHALETIRSGVAHSRGNQALWEAEAFLLKADQLRQVLDSLISPATEHLAVVSALQISQIIVLTHADMKNIGGSMTQQLLNRSDDRIVEGYRFLTELIQLQNKLIAMCRSRGLPLEIEDFRPSA